MFRKGSVAFAILGLLLAQANAFAERTELNKGTDVPLLFEHSLSSMTAKVGDRVDFRVKDDVHGTNGDVVIARDTPVVGHVTKVKGHAKYGVNAQIQITLDKVKAVNGKWVPLEPKYHGKEFGKRTDEAAAATIGGAVLLGPVGLIGGYFVNGKKVEVKPGDTFVTEVAKDMWFNIH